MRHHHTNPPQVRRRRDELGASLVEYALLLALIAVVVFGAVSFFGQGTKGGFEKSQRCFGSAYANQEMDEDCG